LKESVYCIDQFVVFIPNEESVSKHFHDAKMILALLKDEFVTEESDEEVSSSETEKSLPKNHSSSSKESLSKRFEPYQSFVYDSLPLPLDPSFKPVQQYRNFLYDSLRKEFPLRLALWDAYGYKGLQSLADFTLQFHDSQTALEDMLPSEGKQLRQCSERESESSLSKIVAPNPSRELYSSNSLEKPMSSDSYIIPNTSTIPCTSNPLTTLFPPNSSKILIPGLHDSYHPRFVTFRGFVYDSLPSRSPVEIGLEGLKLEKSNFTDIVRLTLWNAYGYNGLLKTESRIKMKDCVFRRSFAIQMLRTKGILLKEGQLHEMIRENLHPTTMILPFYEHGPLAHKYFMFQKSRLPHLNMKYKTIRTLLLKMIFPEHVTFYQPKPKKSRKKIKRCLKKNRQAYKCIKDATEQQDIDYGI